MSVSCVVAATARPDDAEPASRALAAARQEVAACERVLSRFDPTSDLSRLNDAGGEWASVDRRLIVALALALRAREQTGGRFDPTILPVLVAFGYDRTFEQLEQRPARDASGWSSATRIDLDLASERARLERGAAVDLGGIGKGFAADRALVAMRKAWPELRGARIELGGDVAVWGVAPGGGPWRLPLADPRQPGATLGSLRLREGGVATSSRDERRFGPGRRYHHLIDPATAAPALHGPLSVTVVALDAAEAEAHATALALLDPAEAPEYVRSRPQIAALLVPDVGAPVALGELTLGRAQAPAGAASS